MIPAEQVLPPRYRTLEALSSGTLALLLLNLLLVKLKLLAFQDVPIGTATLPGSGGNASKQPAAGELVLQLRVKLLADLPLSSLCQYMRALFLLLLDLNSFLVLLHSGLLLFADFKTVMLAVPGTERNSVNLDDGILHQGLGADELIVGRIVHHIQNSCLTSHSIKAPQEIASVQTQRPELGIPSPNSDTLHCLIARQLGHGTLPPQLVLALLAP
jgi:hypothetical protein